MVNRKFTITPLGSCRIASPSRAGVETHGIAVIRPRSYGFTHSSAEAVQQARFMVEGNSIPPDLWPLIGRDKALARLEKQGYLTRKRDPRDARVSRVYLTAKAVCDLVLARFGLGYTPHAMARLLGRLGFVWKRPKVVPAKADEAAQRAFLDGTLLPLMAAAEADPAETLLFVDATHPAMGKALLCPTTRIRRPAGSAVAPQPR